MMKNKQQILLQIKQTIKSLEPQSEIILFGSRARGDSKADSDWDLLILVPYEADLKEEQRFRHKLFELELEFGEAISTLVKSKKEWDNKFFITPLYQNIATEGVPL